MKKSLPTLTHLRILVTRPKPAATELCDLIAQCGGHAIHFPTIAFAPAPDQPAFIAGIHALANQDWLIFISPQAVYSSINTIKKIWPHFPETIKVAAIGAGTTEALRKAGYTVTAQPVDNANSEGLLALPEFQSVTQQKMAIIRGLGGRELVDAELRARGANVLTLIAYERVLPAINIEPVLTLLEQQAIDVVVCTSYEGVKNLKHLLGENGWPFLKKIPMIVVSERIKFLALDSGFQTIWVARDASQTAILETCEKIRI